jgi:hypothetical protein
MFIFDYCLFDFFFSLSLSLGDYRIQFTNLIIYTSILLILYVICLILYATPVYYYPSGWIVLVFTTAFISNLVSLTQIYIFRRPEGSQTTTSSKKSGGAQDKTEPLNSPQQTPLQI